MASEAEEDTKSRGCPFPECDWNYEYGGETFGDEFTADFRSERHYEREHAGRVRVQITLEYEALLGSRDPAEIRERKLDTYDPNGPYEVAHVRTEVVEEADDHSVLEGDDATR